MLEPQTSQTRPIGAPPSPNNGKTHRKATVKRRAAGRRPVKEAAPTEPRVTATPAPAPAPAATPAAPTRASPRARTPRRAIADAVSAGRDAGNMSPMALDALFQSAPSSRTGWSADQFRTWLEAVAAVGKYEYGIPETISVNFAPA